MYIHTSHANSTYKLYFAYTLYMQMLFHMQTLHANAISNTNSTYKRFFTCKLSCKCYFTYRLYIQMLHMYCTEQVPMAVCCQS